MDPTPQILSEEILVETIDNLAENGAAELDISRLLSENPGIERTLRTLVEDWQYVSQALREHP